MIDVLETQYVPLVRIQAVKERLVPYSSETIYKPELVVKMANKIVGNADKEYVLVVTVDSKCHVNSIEVVAVGGLDFAYIQPREIFKNAINSNAYGIIILHNHPSGDLEVSESDIALTKRMKEAGNILGIPLLDHIIIGDKDDFVSIIE